MSIEEQIWDVCKRLEDTGVVKCDRYEIIENPSYRQYFDLVNTLPWATLTDDNKAVSVDGKKIDYDKDVFMSAEEYIMWELQKLTKKVNDLAKSHPRLMECHMTLKAGDKHKKVTKVLVLPQIGYQDYM